VRDTLIQLQVFFEIAMSIGNSLNLTKMLQVCLSTYLAKLGCSAGAVIATRSDGNDRYRNEVVFSIPRRIQKTPNCVAGLERVSARFSPDERAAFCARLPIVQEEADNRGYSHIFDLPGFGFLVLFKANKPLQETIPRSLKAINKKLADSCLACRQNEKINHLVGRLQSEIDERARAEDALRDAHDRFLTVMDSIDATVYVADFQTHEILYMNRNMVESFGGNHEGQLCYRVFRNRSTPCANCTNRLLLDGDGCPTGVHVWEGQNSVTNKWYINYDRAVKWVDGKWVRLQIATDISQIKELQQKQIKAETQLRQSQKMESIGNLAGGIAHDFNNIIASIIGFTELALDEALEGSDSEDYLNEVYIAARRAKDLVKQILAFARQSDAEIKPIRIDAIIKEVLKLIRSSIPSNIQIIQHIESDALIQGNPTQVHQILMNLFTNAAHAMEADGGILEVSLKERVIDSSAEKKRHDLRYGRYIILTVSDTGAGISPEHLGAVFEPYFTTKATGKGTGLGLAMVHGIVESYGGKIAVESELNQGSLFTVLLPITSGNEVKGAHESGPLALGLERILVIDDEAQIAKMNGRILERLGYSVSTRTSSLEALELFRSRSRDFDLVITDLTMPNMTGDQLAVELLKIRPDIPVILCTGFSERISEDEALDMGIKAFAYKPIIMAELANTVREVLEEGKRSPPLPTAESS
jgi:signal transduction histidine kinase/CheY-like chemotaxis protein